MPAILPHFQSLFLMPSPPHVSVTFLTGIFSVIHAGGDQLLPNTFWF